MHAQSKCLSRQQSLALICDALAYIAAWVEWCKAVQLSEAFGGGVVVKPLRRSSTILPAAVSNQAPTEKKEANAYKAGVTSYALTQKRAQVGYPARAIL